MADLDQLSIQITSDSKKAEDAIEGLIRGLTNLNDALGNLDVSKITAFTNAVSKLSNIGSTTNTTSKALRGMSNQLSKTFGIKSKEGIKDLNVALNDFYEATKRSSKDSSLPTQQMYVDSAKALHKAITENASYKKELRDDVRIVKDFYDAQKANGSVFSLKGYKDLFDDKTWAEYKKSLGSVFTFKKFSNQQGVGDIENFFSSLYKKIPDKAFFSDPQNPLDTAEAIKKLVEYLDEARNSTLRYKEAVDSQVISGNEAKEGVIAIGEQLKALVREQNEFSGENGLKGVVSAMQALGSVKLPDMTGVADAVKALNANPPSNTAKAVADIGSNASNSAKQVEELTGKLDKVQRVIEGNEIKDYQRGFTMKDSPKPQSVQYPPAVIEQAEVYQEKLLPAIIDTQNEVDSLYQHMMAISSVEPIYDAITEKFVEWKTQLMEMNGAISGDKWIVPEFKGNADFNRQQVGWVSNIKPEVVEGYFYEIEDAAEKCLPAIRNVGETALALSNQFSFVGENVKKAFDPIEDAIQKAREFKKVISEMESGKRTFDSKQYEDAVKGYDEATKKIKDFKQILKGEMQDAAEKPALDNIEKGAERVKTALEEVIEKAREFKQVISEMESGKRAFDPQQYEDAIKGYDQATKKIQEYKKSLTGGTEKPTVTEGVLPQLVVLGKELGELSHKFGELGNKAIGLFKGMVKPLQWASGEYVEKFRGMQETIQNFQMKFRASMKKVSDFWKRTMRTFTFMIVRKAIDAVVKEVGTAIQSLAMYSNAMGTAFNTDLSNMVADFQYLGRSIVSVFAPLLNYIAPIIDAIVDKIATLISYIGMLFAALGGSTSFTKAKKNVGNYAESLDQASKSAKNLTMGIDELNIISDSKSSGSAKPYDGWEDAWEDVEIPDWILNLADKFKELFEKLLAPLKEAWERVKERFLGALNFMKENLLYLFKSIGDAFLEVWQQEATIKIFENLLNIIADVMIMIGILAKHFADAWNEAERGVRIFEGIRDIIGILVQHFVNLTDYMVSWAASIRFEPLLDSVIGLLDAFKLLADFIGGVFEDAMRLVVLKYIKWMIEEGIPHLNNTIKEMIEAFNFTKIRDDLVPLEKAFERLAENIHTGTTNAIGNLGKEIARFTNSEEFTKFLQRLADIMDLISAEDVEKVLTGIGLGIIKIGESFVKFVNSDTFMSFLERLDKWLDNASAEDIAGIIEKIALAIGLFNFAAFVTEGLSGFFKFATVLKGLTDLHNIASGLEKVGVGGKVAGEGFSLFSTASLPIVGIIAAIVIAVYSLVESYGGLDGACQEIIRRFDEVNKFLEPVKKNLKFDNVIDNLKASFERLGEKLGDLKDLWDVLLTVVQVVAGFIGTVLLVAFTTLAEAVSIVIDVVSTLVDVLGGVGTMIKGIFEGDPQEIIQGASRIGNAIVDGVKDGISHMKHAVEDETTEGVKEGLLNVPSNISETADTTSKTIASNFSDSYVNASVETGTLFKDTTLSMLSTGLGAVNDVDYSTPAKTFTDNEYAEYVNAIGSRDYTTLGETFNGLAGQSILSSSQLFSDANKTTSEQGASTFGQSYVDYITSNDTMGTSLVTYGQDVGSKLVEGINQGIVLNMEKTKPIIDSWFTYIEKCIHSNSVMPFGSPNKKTQEYGKDLVTGLNLGITTNATTTLTAIDTWFSYIQTSLTNKLNEVKTLFNTMLTDIFSGNGWDYTTPILTLFTNVTTAIIEQITLLGETLLNETLPMFMETYILPFFSIDLWQPYFDILLNEVFMVSFENFLVWFDEQMNAWWTDHMVIWFEASKWNKDLFDPVKKNYTDRYKNFILWFDKSIKDWWENKMMPYFKVAFWNSKIFDPLKQNRETRYQTFITWFTRSIKDWWENKLMPYFKVTFWNEKIYEPLKQNRESRYKAFIDWFSKSIKDWWENKLMPYLKVSFWDSEIFNPLKESIQTHFKNFVSWWILSMNLWWTADVVPYFKQDRWQEQFDHIKVVAEEVFSYIERFITENINKAKDSVVNACNSMIESLSDVLNRLHDIEDTLRRLQDMGFDIGNFEMGGFPNEGSLFFAGERGAELIGSVNGRTAVTSNDEITGIREAIAESGNQEAAYLSQLIAITTQLLDKDPVVIGDRDIAEMAESGKNLLGMQIIT